MDNVLSGAWRATGGRVGSEPRSRTTAGGSGGAPLGWFDSLDGFGSLDPAQDLLPVCPNCHAMIHQRKPAYSVKEIKALLRKNREPRRLAAMLPA